jgi:hypothetical protein
MTQDVTSENAMARSSLLEASFTTDTSQGLSPLSRRNVEALCEGRKWNDDHDDDDSGNTPETTDAWKGTSFAHIGGPGQIRVSSAFVTRDEAITMIQALAPGHPLTCNTFLLSCPPLNDCVKSHRP